MIGIRPARAEDESAVLGLVDELFAPPARRPIDYTLERGRAGFRHALAHPEGTVRTEAHRFYLANGMRNTSQLFHMEV